MKTTKFDQGKVTHLMGSSNCQRQAGRRRHDPARRTRALRPLLEQVEVRQLLSGAGPTIMPIAIRLGPPTATLAPNQIGPAGTASPSAYTPLQIQTAYGFSKGSVYNNNISFGATKGDGTNQTIAIVDAYDDPNLVDSTASNFNSSDLAEFDKQFNLPSFSFTKYNEYGQTTNLPGTDPSGPGTDNWEVEEALDVEWAHAMAPGATILLVEANDASYLNLFAAVDAARNLSGVSVVSMSWGSSEFSGETSYDAHFQTPAGHIPITFVAASGDYGTISYPAASPEVLSVGGTNLTLGSGNTWSSELGWSGSGGGVSSQESLPTYQSGVVPTGTNTNTTMRESPDVAYNAGYGVDVYDSYNNGTVTPWSSIGGTSAGAPQWSALIAIANQGRAVNSLTSLNGYSQTLPFLYSAPSNDFHDIIYGQNYSGYQAGPGYDMVTGLGTPNAAQVVGSLDSLSLLPVFGTGVSTTGALLPTTPPSGGGTMPIDPHYTLVTPPSTYTPAAGLVGPAYVLNSSDWVLSTNGGPYVADGPNSEWISPDPSGSSAYEPGGYYDYRLTFVVPNEAWLNPETVLMGNWAVDNEGYMLLNGKPVTSSGGTISTTTAASFDTLHPFKITGVTGTNTLDFIVHNDGESPTGLRVNLIGTVYYTVSILPTGGGGGTSLATSFATSLGTPQSLAMSSSTASPVKSSRSISSQNRFDSALSSVSDGNLVAPSWIISLNNGVFDVPGLGKKKSIALTT